MAKIILSFAIVFLAVMTVFVSAAEADPWGGRGYGGPIGVGPDFGSSSKSYSPKRSRKERVYRRTKKRKARPAKKVDTAKTAPIETEAENENSAISATSLETNKTVDTETKAKDEPATTKNVGCKKYFPSVGQTLTVACE